MAQAKAIRAEPPSVTDELNRWCDKFPRIKELMDGTMWSLCREAPKGHKFKDGSPPEFLYKIERPDEYFPHITIRYRYTDEEVIVLDVRIIPLL
jgi:hypothetical protein